MCYFDLSIPYLESSPSDKIIPQKTTRIKLVTKAMELGYTGIAYNRTIKGVMSDHDRCSITLLTLSSLLKIAPSLSSSVNFHRDLLGVPRASPFRQYTRLTVCVESVTQGQALNSGNPILKSYDIVAVRPLNQSAFDHACERAEVDMISVDFSGKLPFRLKLPMVKAANERGVYFEITYSNLIVDAQTRRQMISNAKLLVDWTRGKNLIFSSAAPSVNELRGPNNVANLSYLLGLSTERANAAISKNCRTLIAKALKKKHFYKEAIRVELAASSEQFNSNQPWPGDWLKWDSIASGEGDLLLDDMAKAFSATNKASKTVKGIDFASVIDSMPSHGFQVKDSISGMEAVPQPPANGENNPSATEMTDVLLASTEFSQQSSRLDIIPETYQTSSDNIPLKHQIPSGNYSQNLYLPRDTAKALITYFEEVETQTTTPEEELIASQKCISRLELGVESQNEKVASQTLARDVELDAAACNASATAEVSTLSEDNSSRAPQNEECRTSRYFDAKDVAMDIFVMEMDRKDNADASMALHIVSLHEHSLEKEPFAEQEDDTVTADRIQCLESCEEMKVDTDSSVSNHEAPEVVMVEDQNHGAADSEINLPTLVLNDLSSQENVLKAEQGDDTVDADRIQCLESCEEMKVDTDSSVSNHEAPEVVMVEDRKHGAADTEINIPTLVLNDLSSQENFLKGEPFTNPGEDTVDPDRVPFLESYDEIKIKTDSLVAHPEAPEEVMMDEQEDREVDTEINHPTLAQSISGKARARRRIAHQLRLLPFKHFLNPVLLKRKRQKI